MVENSSQNSSFLRRISTLASLVTAALVGLGAPVPAGLVSAWADGPVEGFYRPGTTDIGLVISDDGGKEIPLIKTPDLEGIIVKSQTGAPGRVSVTFYLKDAVVSRVAELTGKHVGDRVDVIWAGQKLASPSIGARIEGLELGVGVFPEERAKEMFAAMKREDSVPLDKLLKKMRDDRIQRLQKSKEPADKLTLGGLFIKDGNFAQAIAVLQPIVGKPNREPSVIAATGISLLARAYTASGDMKGAEDFLTAWIAQGPKFFALKQVLSQVYAQQKNFEKAYQNLVEYDAYAEGLRDYRAIENRSRALQKTWKPEQRDAMERQLAAMRAQLGIDAPAKKEVAAGTDAKPVAAATAGAPQRSKPTKK